MFKSTSTLQGQISNCKKSISEAIQLCEQVAGEHEYDFHFNLQSFKDELQTMDLKDWKVKISKGREILNEVTKVLELERKTRTYVHELHDEISKIKLNENKQ